MRTKDSRTVLRGLGCSNAPRLPGAVADWQRQSEAGGNPSALALRTQFNAIKKGQFPWVYEVTKCAARGAFMDVAADAQKIFEGRKAGRKTGFPCFKRKKRSRQSF
jgi:putative transposase